MTEPAEQSDADRARETLRVHVDDGTGYCEGCKTLHAFLVPYPCTLCGWANRTLIIEGAGAVTP